jgi:DNA-binding transcriptional MerR regulator
VKARLQAVAKNENVTSPVEIAGDRFTRQDLCRILRVSDRQLATWQRKGLVPDAADYNFSDLLTLKTIRELRKNHVPIKRIQRSLEAMRHKLGEVEHPLSELKISLDGRQILVDYEGTKLEPVSGQFRFDFETRRGGGSVRVLKPGAASVGPSGATVAATNAARALTSKQEAEAWFAEGLRLEEKPDTVEQAIAAYRQAIALNPEAAGAFINLGTIYYNLHRLSDAENCYRAAAEIDPQYALAFFNLGNVFDERASLDEARTNYQEALRINPAYADAHYNLALVLEKLGQRGKALHHWRRYLKLDPGSPWAAYARQQLARSPFQVLEGGESEMRDRGPEVRGQ